MEWLLIIAILVITCLVLWYFFSSRVSLETGQLAPDFKLTDQNGNLQSLTDFQGKWLALYFYPKDDTRGVPDKLVRFVMILANLRRWVLKLSVLAWTRSTVMLILHRNSICNFRCWPIRQQRRLSTIVHC